MRRRRSIFLLISILFTTLLIVGVSLFARFAEVASGSVKISPELVKQKIVSKSSGNIRLIKSDGEQVGHNEVIAYISNGLDMPRIRYVDSLFSAACTDLGRGGFVPVDFIPYDLSFLEPYLSTFYEAQVNWSNYRASQENHHRLVAYENAISRNRLESNVLSERMLLAEGELMEQQKLLVKYEDLLSSQMVDEQQVLLLRRQIQQLKNEMNGLLLKKIEIENHSGKLRDDIHILDSEKTDRGTKLYGDYQITLYRLRDKFSEWKEHNLLTAKINGTVQFLREWKDYDFVRVGDDIMSIYPQTNKIIADGFIDKKYLAKLQKGQQVYIFLDGYSYLEHGKIKGELQHYSPMQNEEGLIHIAVKIDYPITTTTNKRVKYFPDASGSLQVVLDEKSIFSHLVDNFFNKFS